MLEWSSAKPQIEFLLTEWTRHVHISVSVSPSYWNAAIMRISGWYKWTYPCSHRKGTRDSEGTAPPFLKLGGKWQLQRRSDLPYRTETRLPPNSRLCWPRSRSGHWTREEFISAVGDVWYLLEGITDLKLCWSVMTVYVGQRTVCLVRTATRHNIIVWLQRTVRLVRTATRHHIIVWL